MIVPVYCGIYIHNPSRHGRYIHRRIYCEMPLLIHVLTSMSMIKCHQMETFSALLAICAGNSPVPGEFPTQRPVTRSFDVFFDLRLNKRLGKQSWRWWFETLSCPLWCHRNAMWVNSICKLHSIMWVSYIICSLITVTSKWARWHLKSPDCSGADQRKPQSSALLAFVRENHWWLVDSPH